MLFFPLQLSALRIIIKRKKNEDRIIMNRCYGTGGMYETICGNDT